MNVIHIGNDTAIPARFIAAIMIDQNKAPLDKTWAVRVYLTEGLPGVVVSFESTNEQEARETYQNAVAALKAYYAD